MPATKWTPPSRRNPPWYSGILRPADGFISTIIIVMRPIRHPFSLHTPALTLSVIVLIIISNELVHGKAKRHYIATNLLKLLRRIHHRLKEPPVFSHGPDGRRRETSVPVEQVFRRRGIFGDGLLAENVLPRGDGLLDHGGLAGDRQRNDDGLNVVTGKEGVKILIRVKGVVKVRVGLALDARSEVICGLLGSGVDGFELEQVAGFDCGDVFYSLSMPAQARRGDTSIDLSIILHTRPRKDASAEKSDSNGHVAMKSDEEPPEWYFLRQALAREGVWGYFVESIFSPCSLRLFGATIFPPVNVALRHDGRGEAVTKSNVH